MRTIAGLTVMLFWTALASAQTASPKFLEWAQTPPMGWNSWDCFGAGVTEAETRENTEYMAEKLKAHGWQYIVVDIQWYEPQARTTRYRPNAELTMDANGRLMPAVNRFPSAADGKGFKALADYVHSKGLKFGIHLMRGIPRQAVRMNVPILGTNVRAQDIADTNSICTWNTDMYGVDMSKPGAQEYYNSVFNLIASWDVDYVKVDDLSRPYLTNIREVEAIRKAIDQTGRPMVLSLSPGETTLEAGDHVKRHANLWRISDDFWDEWRTLKEQFVRCDNWSKFTTPGAWPDADMLPFGGLRQWQATGNWTRFTKDEQLTVMSLWVMCRSPLMMGGHMPRNDEFTLSLLTNDEILAINQKSTNGRQIQREGDLIVWTADVPGSMDKYLAFFNATDIEVPTTAPARRGRGPQIAREGPAANVSIAFSRLGFNGPVKVRDLWAKQDMGTFNNEFARPIPYHGAGVYRISPN